MAGIDRFRDRFNVTDPASGDVITWSLRQTAK